MEQSDDIEVPPSEGKPSVNSFAQSIRELAAKQSDPDEAASLLRSAERVEDADREFRKALKEGDAELAQLKAWHEAMRTRDHLPKPVVWAVLIAFAAFLIFVTLKHHV